jgi:hypothetical protein
MKTFIGYISESTINARGSEGERHVGKYIKPYLPGGEKHAEGTHVTKSAADHIPAGSNVTIHGHKVIDGVHHAEISAAGHDKKVTVPVSKLKKPTGATKVENKGHEFEKNIFHHFAKHGLVPQGHKPAGSTAGTDFTIVNKKKNTTHKGKIASEEHLHGEAKANVSAAFGQLTIRHDPKKGGWHIPDEARAKRPEYAKAIEHAGVLAHMNKHESDPHKSETTASGRAKNVTIKHPDLKPAEAYLKDHHVHVLHVGSHGTYSVGEKDPTGHGLPRISGTGKWTVREKRAGSKTSRTVMFQPHGAKGLEKSHINLEHPEHIEAFKKTLGHK